MNKKTTNRSRHERRTLARLAVVEAVWADIRENVSETKTGRLIFYPSVVRLVEGYNSGEKAFPAEVEEVFPQLAISTVVNWFNASVRHGDGALIDNWGYNDKSGAIANNTMLHDEIRYLLKLEPKMSATKIRDALIETDSGYEGKIPSVRTLQRIIVKYGIK